MDLTIWIKALHVMAVISWMAGIFYLPRLFVYHAEATPGSDTIATLQVMEDKLLKIIMRPAMIVSWLSGLYLAWALNAWLDGWFLMKAALVVAMTVFHMKCAIWRKELLTDSQARGGKYFRIANEVPTILMVIIVLMVIVKPF